MTYKELAQQSLDIQDASNLSGVVHAMALEARERGHGTGWINQHPIVTLFIDKLAHLNRSQADNPAVSKAYDQVHKIIET